MPGKRASNSANSGKVPDIAQLTQMAQRVAAGVPIDGNDNALVERPKKLLLDVQEAMGVLDYTRPRFYRAVNSGDIEVLKDSKRTRVPYASCAVYVRNLCKNAGLSPEVISLIG